MGTTHTDLKALYETNYYTWIREMVHALREHRTEDLDWENLAEEVEDLGKFEKRELTGFLSQCFTHLIKYTWLLETHPGNENRGRKDAKFLVT